jgi:type I restriction enzyme S subunit
MRPTDAIPHPQDWSIATIAKSVEVRRGVSWSKEQEHREPGEGRIPVIGIGNVQSDLELEDMIYLSGLKPAAVERARVSAGWTLMVGSNGNRARVGNAILIREDADYLFASFLLGVRPKRGSGLRDDYFYRWVSSEQVQAYLSASSEGTTGLNNLSHSFFRAMSVPFPRADEQAAITRILDAVDTALERTRAAVERARELERGILEDAFENLRAPRLQLREFTTDVRYGTSKASSERGWGNPVLRIPNVIADRLLLDDLAFVELPKPDVERLQLRDGDLLLVRTNGNPAYVGRSVVFRVPDARTWVYASYLIRVRLKAGLLPEFVNIYLGLERGRRELLRRVTTSAGNHNINSNSIRLLRLPVPANEDDQTRIVALARALRKQVDTLGGKTEALETLKKSLMHDLLTGRVRVRDAAGVVAS